MIRKTDKSNKFKPIYRHKLGYIVSWDFKYSIDIEFDDEGNIISEQENKDIANWMIEYFDEIPTIEQIKKLIADYYGEGFDADKFDWKPYEDLL